MLFKITKRTYLRMTNEEYLANITKSWSSMTFNRAKLKGMPEANHGTNTTVALYGLPKAPVSANLPLIQEACIGHRPELLFLQMDPMNYLIRQRFIAHKCALNEVEEYDIRGVDNIQYPRPHSWEE